MELSLPPVASRVLVADDEPHVRKFLRLTLQAEGLDVFEAATAEEAVALVHRTAPDLLILDLGLPDIDGLQVIRDVRRGTAMPILVLSGRTDEGEKIAALEFGADDYLEKPFAMQDLVFRVHAALDQQCVKRGHRDPTSVLTGELNIHLDQPEVTRNDHEVLLDDDEYAILRLLAMHGGRVLTLAHIERALWGKEGDSVQHRDVQKRITGLRRKIETEPSFPRYIVTEPSVGYRLEMLPPGVAGH